MKVNKYNVIYMQRGSTFRDVKKSKLEISILFDTIFEKKINLKNK